MEDVQLSCEKCHSGTATAASDDFMLCCDSCQKTVHSNAWYPCRVLTPADLGNVMEVLGCNNVVKSNHIFLREQIASVKRAWALWDEGVQVFATNSQMPPCEMRMQFLASVNPYDEHLNNLRAMYATGIYVAPPPAFEWSYVHYLNDLNVSAANAESLIAAFVKDGYLDAVRYMVKFVDLTRNWMVGRMNYGALGEALLDIASAEAHMPIVQYLVEVHKVLIHKHTFWVAQNNPEVLAYLKKC